MTPTRRLAYRVLRAAASPGVSLAELLATPEIEALPKRDRGFLHELVLGTLRSQGILDHALGALVERPLGRLDIRVLTILRLGAYQLLKLEVPHHAAVSESVALAKKVSTGGAGLVNAVLRRLAKEGPRPLPDPLEDPRGWLVTGGSLPSWLAERWITRLGADRAIARARAFCELPARVFRLNPRVKDAAERVARSNPRPCRVPGALLAESGPPVALAEEGILYVQDEGAQLAAAVLPVSRLTWDTCAAPGGKSTALADRLEQGCVLATEVSLPRLRTLKRLVARWGARNVAVVGASVLAPPLSSPAGAILLDAPCSGLGTLSRHPDIRWRARPEDPRNHAARQGAFLRSASAHLSPGGAIVYATCSLEPEETVDVVGPFLAENPEFHPLPFPKWAASFAEGPYLAARPEETGGDGFFVALLGRR